MLIVIAITIFFINLLQKLSYSPDDTFIYMQYARNIADGAGFSFNSGEPSYGVTSPLWVLFLSIPYFSSLDGFWFAKTFDLIFALLSVIYFYRLSKTIFVNEPFLSYISVFFFIVNPWFIRWSFTGMETSLAVLLSVLAFYLYYGEKFRSMFMTLGIFLLVRPESFVLVILLSLLVSVKLIKEKKFYIKEACIYLVLLCLPIILFMIYANTFFGTILPNTAAGKSTLTLSPQIILNQVREIFKVIAGSSIIELFLTLVFLIISVKRKDFQKTLPFLFWIFGLIFLYTVTDADIISRYLLIITPFFIILGLKTFENLKNYKVNFAIISTIICLLYSQFIFYKFVKPSTDDFTVGVNECFIPIGNWLHQNTPQSSKILMNDVGAVGYYSQRYVIDAAALINRDIKLNREIMSMPVEDRMNPYKMLSFINADYFIERDSSETSILRENKNYKFELMFMKKFPSLGIKDSSPRYYKVYKIKK